MAHNPSDSSDIQPGGGEPPPSNAPSPGPAPETAAPVGQDNGAVSELSDIVDVTDELHKLYSAFNPSIHATNPDGSPRLKKGGGFALKRGRKSGATPAAPSTVVAADGSVQTVQAAPAKTPQISNKEAAQLLCGLTEGALIMVFGDEWDSTPEEAKGLAKSTEAYLQATGGMDMSPGVGLAFAWGGYAIPRLAKPKTRSKLAEFGSWLVSLFRRQAK